MSRTLDEIAVEAAVDAATTVVRSPNGD